MRYVRGLEFRPGNRARRAPREHQDRSHAGIASARRSGSCAGLRRAAPAFRRLPRRPFSRLDAGTGRPAAAERAGVASRARHRPGRRSAHEAERQDREHRAVDRALFRRRSSGTDARHAAARAAEHRHPGRREALHDRRLVRAAGRRRGAGRPAARALPCARGDGRGDAARRHDEVAHLHQDWDVRWQHVYRYVTPFALPRGTTLEVRYTYDNSADNPRNPELPPRRVRWGNGPETRWATCGSRC